MANRFQKLLFNLSTLSPIVFVATIVWWIQSGKSEIVQDNSEIYFTAKATIISIVGIIGLLFSFYSFLVVKLSKRAEIVPIMAASVKSKDRMIIGAIVSYLLPFASLVFADYNIWILIVIGILALLALVLTNTVWSNPILIVFGYHFYEISNINGSQELPLISSRKSIQDAKTINNVITLWDYFLIEVK